MVSEQPTSARIEARENQRIRRLRSPKPQLSIDRAIGTELEFERRLDGRVEQALTIFLAGAECPFTCAFCDLWRFTIDGPTPAGAIPAQIRRVLDELELSDLSIVKLYNASNFFDSRAIPPADDASIAELVKGIPSVVVEAHPKLIGPRCVDFARLITGQLEVAIGFETFHPEAMPRLNKGVQRDDYHRAADLLLKHEMRLRAFVLLGAPYVPPAETLEWTFRTVSSAVRLGAEHISLIPVRGGNGELERLATEGLFSPPRLEDLEDALELCLDVDAVVSADLWDLELLADCASCFEARRERLEHINATGSKVARIECDQCGHNP